MDKEIIFSKVDKSIRTIINKFRERCGEFVSENDLHCYLYNIMHKNGVNEFNKRLILHKEFPSCRKRGKGRRKGLFDIVVLDPNTLNDRIRESKVLIAMEFKLIRANYEKQIGQIENDFEQISEEIENNNIERGYVFVFDQIGYKHKERVVEILNQHKLVKGYYLDRKDKAVRNH